MNSKVTIENPYLTKGDRLYALIQSGIAELKKHSKDGYNPEENGILIYIPESLSHDLNEPISYLRTHLPIIDQIREFYPSAIITTCPLSLTMTGKDSEGTMKSLDGDKIICMSKLPSKHPLSFEDFVEIEIEEGN